MNSSAYILFLVLLGIVLLGTGIILLTDVANHPKQQWVVVIVGIVMMLIASWIYIDAKPK
jgi:thiol:disulfide interchange protein